MSDIEWIGMGNPPNNCECEYSTSDGISWRKCKVLFISNAFCILEENGGEYIHELYSLTFKPIKSEREKAIEEMLEINIWTTSIEQHKAMEGLCEQLYDAGYRKVNHE